MAKYFTGVKTVEKLWKRHRELLRKYHPGNEIGPLRLLAVGYGVSIAIHIKTS